MFAPPANAQMETKHPCPYSQARNPPMTIYSRPGSVTRRAAILPRAIGNQAALRFLTAAADIEARPKLTVGPADDPLEREADRIAAQVLRMPAAEQASSTVARSRTRNHKEQQPSAVTCAACQPESVRRQD